MNKVNLIVDLGNITTYPDIAQWLVRMTTVPQQIENSEQNADLISLVSRIARLILQSPEPELPSILAVTASEIRNYLGTDRVKIYQFHPDGSGQVVAESIKENCLPSLLGLNFPADDIPEYIRKSYIESRTYSIINLDNQQISFNPQANLPLPEQELANQNSRTLDPCHLEYLTAMGVKFSLVIPILLNQKLWGLLVAHHRESLTILKQQLEDVQATVDQLAVAISQAALITEARVKGEREATINQITTYFGSLPHLNLQKPLEETIQAFHGSGGRLYITTSAFEVKPTLNGHSPPSLDQNHPQYRIFVAGSQPTIPEHFMYPMMEQYSCWSRYFQSANNQVWAIADLYQTPELRNLQLAFRSTKIRGILIVPLHYGEQIVGYLSVFRDERETETFWAGEFDPDVRQEQPRQSFELWKQLKKGQIHAWDGGDREMLQTLGSRFSSAIQQYEMHQQVHKLNSSLEKQVQERTTKLQQATQQQQILFDVVTKMRQSLDFGEIFNSTSQGLRRALKSERVCVYRFDPESKFNEGEFIAESVALGFNSVVAIKVRDHCFGEIYATKYSQGKIHAVTDIHNAGLTDCHISILAQFQTRAQLVIPIIQSKELWGLLCIHQCSQPRNWETSDIKFAKQVAAQLGVALEQADLLTQTRTQTLNLKQRAEQQKSLLQVVTNMRESLDLETIFSTMSREVRTALQADRVGIYRFDPNSQFNEGEFVAEDVISGFSAALGAKVQDHCFGENYANLYTQGRVNALNNIYTAGLQECYVAVLEQFHIQASLTAPVIKGNQLWGLLCIHQCSQPRYWQESEIQFARQIASQVSIAVDQADLLTQTQKSAQQQQALFEVVSKIRASLDVEHIFQTTTEEIGRLLQADRVVIYRFNSDWSGEFMAEYLSAGWTPLMEKQWHTPELRDNISECSTKSLTPPPGKVPEDTYLKDTQGGNFAQGKTFRVCQDIYKAGFSDCYLQILEAYEAKAYVIIAIYQGQKLWGLLATYQNSAPRHWQFSEIRFLEQTAAQLGVAIQQADLLAQTQKSAQQQQALFEVVTKIRESLDLQTIFQVTTQETRQLLQAERVTIYQFAPDWGGQFLNDFESSAPEWQDVGRIGENPIWNDTYIQEHQGGRYRHNETFTVNDVHQANLNSCHVETLEQFQIQAFITAPIFVGQKLWGIMAAYQHSTPRNWTDLEISFLANTAAQLGVAIQQADLLTQTQEQAQQLQQAFRELQETQTQLIHTEKMSSLGQLVAGIAHEINNPINFIHGNISHASGYIEELLSLLNLYQEHYPETKPEIVELAEEIDADFLSEDLRNLFNSMKVGTERIKQIILSLLNFSRLDQADLKPVDIHEGIDSSLLILQHRLKASPERPEIKIIKEYGDLPLVECYAGQLNQVFMNLFSNAIDALESYSLSQPKTYIPTITISSTLIEDNDHPSCVTITITDNGSGISESVRNKIFEPFFTTKPVGKGTGLGLSISYQIVVDKHGGSLECHSQLGEGTQFCLEIPTKQGSS